MSPRWWVADLLLSLCGVGLIIFALDYWSRPLALLAAGVALVAGGLLPLTQRRQPPPPPRR
jgi:predicted cobalt transporter CbtA